jgi:hypothetical protein
MIVMPANNSARQLRWLARRYPGRLGHLYSPGGSRGPWPEFQYALDNGCFNRWCPTSFMAHVEWADLSHQHPRWVVVPDVLGDWEATKRQWHRWAPVLAKKYEWPLALAVQDGRTIEEALDLQPDVVFVGGSVGWKWDTVADWCHAFDRVHVGRVNSPRRLWQLLDIGAESCDGTGWWRGDRRQKNGLINFLRREDASN